MNDYSSEVEAAPIYKPRIWRTISDEPDICPKCGGLDISVTYMPPDGITDEHLRLTCTDCHFAWPNRCADAEGGE